MKRKKNTNDLLKCKCPYCGSTITYRSADGIYKDNSKRTMLYVCTNYPVCDAYVRVKPGTREPVGTMADGKLRSLRHSAHHYFDKIHKSGLMTKEEAYRWLAYTIAAPMSEAHIGKLGEYYCNLVIDESKKLLSKNAKQLI